MSLVPRIVLASGSPRRREVLAALGLPFTVRRPDLDEVMVLGESAESTVRRLAEEKATCVPIEPGELVLAADTVVVLDGHLLGKPADEPDAVDMLMRLSGRSHDVFTGLAVRVDGKLVSAAARTEVTFRLFEASECEAYVATGEPMDKAGAYGIQGYGSALVERIHGDYFNVMGLPVGTLLRLFLSVGYRYDYGSIVCDQSGEER